MLGILDIFINSFQIRFILEDKTFENFFNSMAKVMEKISREKLTEHKFYID